VSAESGSADTNQIQFRQYYLGRRMRTHRDLSTGKLYYPTEVWSSPEAYLFRFLSLSLSL